jgi:hypothetical protein
METGATISGRMEKVVRFAITNLGLMRGARMALKLGQRVLLAGCTLWLILPFMEQSVEAMGTYLHALEGSISRCGIESADPKFSAANAVYQVRGKCYVFFSSNPVKDEYQPDTIESTFANERLEYVISWEARGTYTPATKIAEETISVLKRVRPDHENYASIGKINARMECEQDPWLMPHTQRCTLKYFGKDQSLNAYDLSGLYAVRDLFPASSYLASELRASLNSQYRWYHALFQKPGSGGQELFRPDKGLSAKSNVGAVTGSQCNPGFVERLAGPGDNVCVTPESRERARQENATAASRRNPKGPYGPNTCLTGFVWREALAGDVVCVTPEIRNLVKEENALHASRSTGQTSPTQLTRPGTGLKIPSTGLIRPRGVEKEKTGEAPPVSEKTP